MAKPAKCDKVPSSDNSFDIVSSPDSSFSIIDPKEGVLKDLDSLNIKELSPLYFDDGTDVPFELLRGEQDLFKRRSLDGFAVLTNYRFFHKSFSGENHINIPLGLINSIQASGGVLFIFCKNGWSFSLAFYQTQISIWVERIQNKLNHLEKEACFTFTHVLDSMQEKNDSSPISEKSSPDYTTETVAYSAENKLDNLDPIDSKGASSKNGTKFDKLKSAASNGEDAASRKSGNKDASNGASTTFTEMSFAEDWYDTTLMKYSNDYKDSLFKAEVKRMKFNRKDIWRISDINDCYGMCPSYPRHIIVPVAVLDKDLMEVSRYRRAHRIPAVVWRHKKNGKVMARCSQPSQGVMNYSSPADQKLLSAIRGACCKDEEKIPTTLLIVDARSATAAWGNRLNFGGLENVQNYPKCEIEFMGIENIHAVRRSLDSISKLCATPDQVQWLSQLEYTNWMSHISSIIKGALVIVKAIHDDSRPVLVHCSDGWDRTSQLTSLSQLMMDPYYRTIEGLQILVEREWVMFGHKFADRCGHWNGTRKESERSPVFLQWLDCVFQLTRQFPLHFEFNEQYLIRLGIHTYSCLFGTFLCNNDLDRQSHKLHKQTLSVWPALKEVKEFYNEFYSENNEVLRPSCQIRNLKFWSNMFLQNNLVHQNTFDVLPSKEEFESKDNSNASDGSAPKRKTSSPKDDVDPTKDNPLETSDIPEITEENLSDVSTTEIIVDHADVYCLDDEDPEQSSGMSAPLDMLASILPNMYSMYEGLCSLVPSFRFYGGAGDDQPAAPQAVPAESGGDSHQSSQSKWVFEVEKRTPKKCTRMLQFDGLFIQEDIASSMAEKIRKKNECCCKQS